MDPNNMTRLEASYAAFVRAVSEVETCRCAVAMSAKDKLASKRLALALKELADCQARVLRGVEKVGRDVVT